MLDEYEGPTLAESAPAVSRIGVVDFPLEQALVAREGFIVQGFAFNLEAGAFTRVIVRHEGVEIGATTLRHRRPDLVAALPQVWDVTCGYRTLAVLPGSCSGTQEVQICALFENGDSWEEVRSVCVGDADYQAGPYGTLVRPDFPIVYRRDEIYSVGPPSSVASSECLELLTSYVVAGERVLDVGCGIGAYGPPLIALGIDWQGCEVNPTFVADLRERGLPVTHVVEETLPFADDGFESVMCIEVLEHIENYDAFVKEIARVAKRRAFFSVPNAGAIPVLADRLVVPWHMLEADHKNFFSVAGLRATLEAHFQRVDILPYGLMPVQSSNGAPVFYHLFAVAEHENPPERGVRDNVR